VFQTVAIRPKVKNFRRLCLTAMPLSSRPALPALGVWSLTAKLTVASALLCVLCVAATSVVVGLQASGTA
jgi:hypothetical protein